MGKERRANATVKTGVSDLLRGWPRSWSSTVLCMGTFPYLIRLSRAGQLVLQGPCLRANQLSTCESRLWRGLYLLPYLFFWAFVQMLRIGLGDILGRGWIEPYTFQL